jgi:multiple sugar transport system permease protein
VVLLLAIFPLIISLYLSLSRFKFVKGGFEIKFVGLANYIKLFLGSEQKHFLGVLAIPSIVGWMVFGSIIGLLIFALFRRFFQRRFKARSLIGNIFVFFFITTLIWLIVASLGPGGLPGTTVVTLLYVYIGIFFQYIIGLSLALLVTQQIRFRRFFRVIFLIPMMITPVGIAYMFRMLVDTDKGPFQPIWQALDLGLFSWVNNPWSARAAVMLGDIWQWTPFMFIVLLAAIEGQSVELLEAAYVDGSNRWQAFWSITFPQILPVTSTLVLIRMIEAFKIVDLPNVLTNGGPGTATESLTLQSFIAWRSLDLGTSAAIAYSLLFMVTFIGMSYVSLIRSRVAGEQ